MRNLYPWLGLLALAGCKQAPELPAAISPYQMDIQQGNVVTQEMLAKLKAGMTRAQVRYALGSPLVVDPFRTDRWDYVYSLQKQGKGVERRRVTVIFDEDKLLRIEGDVLPVDPSLISDRPLPPKAPASPPPKPEADKPAPKAPVAAQPAPRPAAAPKPEAAKPVEKPVAQPPAAKPEAAPAASPANADAAGGTAASEAAKADGKSAPAEAKKTDTAKTDTGKEKPKTKGFFGRMLDKIGF